MKRLIYIILGTLFVISSLDGYSQNSYRVIKVNGNIIYVSTGANMIQGDVFEEDESLSFETQNSRAAVINPNIGRFILTPENYDDLSSGKSNFLPAMSNISTRGGAINNLMDLQNQFCDYMAIICEASYHINPVQFPMNENQFFYVTFTYKGEKINKKLKFEDTKLILSREEILKVDGNSIEEIDAPDMSLYYFTEDKGEYISDFGLIFPDLDELESEIKIILDESKESSFNKKVNDISGYLYEFYGKPDKEDVMIYLEKAFGLVKE